MSEQVCLPRTHLLIIFCIFSGFTIWYIHMDKKKHLDDPTYKYSDNAIKSLTKTIDKLQQNQEDNERRLFLNQRDNKVIFDIRTAPERRQPEHAYPYPYVKAQLNIPTRGLPDNYQMLGIALRSNTETAFNLFGRQTYPGSDQWEYYVQGSLNNLDVKIPIETRNREIEDGQTIMIPGTNMSKGQYKVKLYNYDTPRYIPSI